ncbi:MAG: hypothetical protein H6824_15325 [Planctomycetaceae bacterium]|nr:hypothetical protein [Planctomycetaceae bacterium]
MKMEWKLTLLSTVCCAFMMGCPVADDGYSELSESDNVENVDAHDEHVHGPHGGHVLEIEGGHAEIAMGADRVVSVYLLGEDGATAAPVTGATAHLHLHIGEEEQEVELTASPLEGEADGATSRFVTSADAVPAAIADIEGIEGEFVLVAEGGKETVVEIGHDHEGHDHEGHNH